jgi:glyoxylase-like metal-dependent hydrolase (beta-lactamase superfamily II)
MTAQATTLEAMSGWMTEPGLQNEQSKVRSIQLGDVRLTYIVDGAMGLTPAGFFPDVPGAYWASHADALDAQGRVAMPAGGLLVERDGRALLIDAGLGDFNNAMSIGGVSIGAANCGALPDTLAALGHSPTDIEAVAFTHLHTDHTGWAFVPDGGGGYRKFFPDARYLLAAQEWAPHGRGELIPGAPSRAAMIEPLGGVHTEFADGEQIFPGVHAVVTPGHSPGHTSYVISTTAGRLIAFGDAFHIPAQLAHQTWPSKPDVDGVAVLAARTRLFAELTEPDTLAFAFHFGDQAFGRVVRDDQGLAGWQPVAAVALLPTPRLLDA